MCLYIEDKNASMSNMFFGSSMIAFDIHLGGPQLVFCKEIDVLSSHFLMVGSK